MSITPDKTLRAGPSPWTNTRGTHAAHTRLTRSLTCDVVIVGAGISGAFMAHSLAGRFDNVVIVDRAPLKGSTAASTCLLQFEIDVPLTKLSEKLGPAKAARAWRHSYATTRRLIRLVEDEAIRCGLRRQQALYVAGNTMDGAALQKECTARNRAGLPGAFLDAAQLRARFGIRRDGAILSPHAASANPVQLAAGLLRRAREQGARLYAPVNIIGIDATARGVTLDTGKHVIAAKHAVFCTGYEVLKGLPRHGTKITSSWATASRPGARYPRWLDDVVLWEAAKPYLYLRTTPDGRLVVGGEDEDIDLASYRACSLATKRARLKTKSENLIPGLVFHPALTWTGAFGESADGLPRIDAVPGHPHCFAVLGFGGNGTVYSKLAAELMPGMLKGRRLKDADLYRLA